MKRIALVLILFSAAFLRLYLLPSLPPSLNWDEASWGYNAYSISTDGKDEFGKLFPTTYLESFGDYKPPVYAYLTAPFVKVLGLNELSVRLPSAILGTATVLLTYLLIKKVFFSPNEARREILALLSAGILAISPWHIMLSRAAFEANVATFFIVLGVTLFLTSLKQRWLLPFSVLAFALSMYTFNTARVFVPLFGLFLLLKYLRNLMEDKRIFTISASFAILLLLPLFLFLLTPEARLRYKEVNIFSDHSVVISANQQMENDGNAVWSKILHNRRVGYALSYVEHYLDNFDPQFLFIRGDGNPKFSIQDVGQLYIWEFPFFVLGLLFLFRKKEGHYLIIPAWILLGIVPAGLARETPHALRIETVLPTFQIISAYGLYYFFEYVRKFNPRIRLFEIFLVILSFLAIFNFLYFMHNYSVHYPKEFSNEWQYGYKEAVEFIKKNESKYENVYFTESLGRPYIYYLFYTKYPPKDFRKHSIVYKDAAGFTHVSRVGNVFFRSDLHKDVDVLENNLFIGDPTKLPSGIKIIKEFKKLDGTPSLVAYEKVFAKN